MSMENKKKINQLTTVEGFKCIGGSCEDSCCTGWTVDVDEVTYKYLMGKTNHKLTQRIQNNLYINEEAFSSEVDYANVILTGDKKCAYLNEARLCDLQLSFGETGISNVCNLYPRVLNKVNGEIERALSISCPEAARKILLTSSWPEIENITEVLPHKFFTYNEDRNLNNANQLANYAFELRAFSMWIIKQSGTLARRLLILGQFFDELEILNGEKAYDKVLPLIDDYKMTYTSKVIGEQIEDPDMYEYPFTMLGYLDVDHEVDNQRFKQFYQQYKDGFGNKKKKQKYIKILDSKLSTLMKEHHFLIENYILNDMYRNVFPFSQPESTTMSYKMLVNKVVLIQLLLAGMLKNEASLEINTIVDLVQAFAKTIEHHHTFLDRVYESSLNSTFELAKLIK